MREIKFRGKTKAMPILTDEIWVYGNLIIDGPDEVYIKYLNSLGSWTQFPVIPDTVGEYTGMHDKFDKEIYEGDIITMEYQAEVIEQGEVSWSQRNMRFVFQSPDGDQYGFDDTEIIEVIGNIYAEARL